MWSVDVSEEAQNVGDGGCLELFGSCAGQMSPTLLAEHYQVFSIEPGDQGETGLVYIKIDTGDSPCLQPVLRMPVAVKKEFAKQLKSMQDSSVIQPSTTPRASSVVMVKKKDGTHRFCVDYRALNAITKPDIYLLPTIDDLLDQLGKSRCFSTLVLTSQYWQIRGIPILWRKTHS